MGIDNDTERRKTGIPIEKWISALLAGSALAFAIYESGAAYLDGLQSRVDGLALDQAVLARDVEFHRADTAAWADRIRLVESRCNEIRERIGSRGP